MATAKDITVADLDPGADLPAQPHRVPAAARTEDLRLQGRTTSGCATTARCWRACASVFGDRRIEDTPIPLHITATDFANGDLVEIASGSIVDAIRASLALPLAFAPVRHDGRLLVDGYLADPLPLSVAMKHGSRVIVGVGFESPFQENVRSAGRFAFQLSAILSNNLLKSRVAFHSIAHHSEMIMILPEFKQRVRLFDTAKVPYIVDEGEQATLQQLPYLRELLAAERRQSELAPA